MVYLEIQARDLEDKACALEVTPYPSPASTFISISCRIQSYCLTLHIY